MAPWNAQRTKVQLKLSIQRTKMLQEKKEAMAKKARREIATLIERGKLETARIKVEGIIAEDLYIELLELMELYSEMLLARFPLLDMNTREPDHALLEPLVAVIHAAPRTELRELHVLREMLMSKYGRDFALAAMENKDNLVSDRVMSKLAIYTPSPDLVDAYIGEICKAYDVPFKPNGESDDNVDAPATGASGGGPAVAEKAADTPVAQANAPLSAETKTPAAEPAAKSAATTPAAAAPAPTSVSAPKKGAGAEQDEFDSLEARFAALKKR